MSFPVKGWTNNRLVYSTDGPLANMRRDLATSFEKGVDSSCEILRDIHETWDQNNKLDVIGEILEDMLRMAY